jgi:hypothetical protein
LAVDAVYIVTEEVLPRKIWEEAAKLPELPDEEQYQKEVCCFVLL